MESLSDKPRSGAPRKLDEAAVECLLQWTRELPLSATELMQRHIEAQCSPVEVKTLIRALMVNGMVCQRTRHSLINRDATSFAMSNHALDKLRAQSLADEIEQAYIDEAFLSKLTPNRSP